MAIPRGATEEDAETAKAAAAAAEKAAERADADAEANAAETAMHIRMLEKTWGFTKRAFSGAGSRMVPAAQAVTSAGRTVAVPLAAAGVATAGYAKEKVAGAALFVKEALPPWFLIFVTLVHIIDAFTSFKMEPPFRLFLYTIVTVMAFSVFNQNRKSVLLGISAWMFMAPYIPLFLGMNPNNILAYYAFIEFLPAWTVFSIYFLGETKNNAFLNFAQWVFMGVAIGVLIFSPITNKPLHNFSNLIPENGLDIGASTNVGLGFFAKTIENFAKATSFIGNDLWNKLIFQATGELPSKTADTTPTGIFMSRLEVNSVDQAIYANKGWEVSTTINAEGLEPEQIIKIIGVKCKQGSGDDWNEKVSITGANTNPTKEKPAEISNYESLYVNCKLDPPKPGTASATIATTYNYKGSADFTPLFMDRDEVRNLRMSNIEPLTRFPGYAAEYGKSPAAVNPKNGPIEVGMDIAEAKVMPVSIKPDSINPDVITLRISLRNKGGDAEGRWRGKVVKLNKLEVKLPEDGSLVRQGDFCTDFSNTGSNSIMLMPSKLEEINEKTPLEKSVVYKCELTVTRVMPNFKTIAVEYDIDYETGASNSGIPVKSGEGSSGSGGSSGGGGGGGTGSIIVPQEVKGKIMQAAQAENVPSDYALAIAYVESGLSHTKEDGTVKVNLNDDGSKDIGIMQINVPTGTSSCKDIGINSESDLYDLDKNIRCGVRIMRNKCNQDNCETNSGKYYSCNGKTYAKWDIAVRNYNGWACGTAAQNSYVEKVNDVRRRILGLESCWTGTLDKFPVQKAGITIFEDCKKVSKSTDYFCNDWGYSREDNPNGHEGTDILAPEGTPVVAVKGGVVSLVKCNRLGGNAIDIRTGNDDFYYGHLSLPYKVKQGDTVEAGQVIGYVGRTIGCDSAGEGLPSNTPPHLHFGIYDLGTEKWSNPFCTLKEATGRT